MPPAYIHDVSTNVLRKQAVNPSLLTATVTMTSLDMLQGDGRCWAEVQIGTFNGTSATLQVSECATTNGTYTDITSASIAATTGTTIAVVTFDRSLRYLKTVVTVSGTTIGYACTVNEAYKVI